MTHASTQLPDDEQLKKLITAVHNELPEPDNHRLMVIEQQLVEKIGNKGVGKRSSKWVWMLVGVLMAGTATATWMIAEKNWFASEQKAEPVIETPLASESEQKTEKPKQEDRSVERAQTAATKKSTKKKRHTIYRQSY